MKSNIVQVRLKKDLFVTYPVPDGEYPDITWDIIWDLLDMYEHNFDFLIIYTAYDYVCGAHSSIRGDQDVSGIGLSVHDVSSIDGMLHCCFMCHINRFTNIEEGIWKRSLIVEMLHRWLVYICHDCDYCVNLTNKWLHELRNWSWAYWNPYASFGKYDPMFGSHWIDNGDGTFTSAPYDNKLTLNELDMYLLGLIHPEEVKSDIFWIEPEEPYENLPTTITPGKTIEGTAHYITIDDIIQCEGLREPTPETSKKDYTALFVLFYHESEGYTSEQAYKLNYIAQNLPSLWSEVTHGKSTVRVVVP